MSFMRLVLVGLGSQTLAALRRVKVWLRETSSVLCIAVVVNSLTCIVSEKQLTSGLAGDSFSAAPRCLWDRCIN